MSSKDYFELGYIAKTHGLDGKVQAFFNVENPDYYSEINAFFLFEGGDYVPYFIDEISAVGDKKFHIRIEDVVNKSDAEAFKGAKLFLPVDLLPELDEGEQYLHDSIGFSVVDATHGLVGELESYVDAGPQLIMLVDANGKEVMIPVHDDIVKATDYENKIVQVDLPNGLLDLYLGSEEED